MKVAVVFNRDSQNVVNLFGVPNREKYGMKAIKRITDALKQNKHQVLALEGDKDLVRKLEEFMPRVVKGERPGMVFNLSYGIQGQARYTHVPGILEMLGIPYVGSGPLAHSLSLDKVVAKMLFKQNGLPTPDFAVLNNADFAPPDIGYPLIVKPRNESTSFGIKIVNDPEELKEAAQLIFDEFGQAVLVERFIEGREVNVGLIGNNPPEIFAPAEIHFDKGPAIYTLEDKKRLSGREVRFSCPADLPDDLSRRIQDISLKAFEVLGCADCARVDLRISAGGEPYILEINSLPSLGEHGSYTMAAEQAGLDFPALVNRLVEVAAARYFGTPTPPKLDKEEIGTRNFIFSYVTKRREVIENRLKELTNISSRTDDVVGVRRIYRDMDTTMHELGLRESTLQTEDRHVSMWETEKGMEGGTLFVGHVDVPIALETLGHGYKREPEFLYGEGIGSSRGPLVTLEYALRAIKNQGLLKKLKIGVLLYADEGSQCRYSKSFIRDAARRARNVIVLSPGTPKGNILTGCRGLRVYRLVMEGAPRKLGQNGKKPNVLPWALDKVSAIISLSDKKKRLALGVTDLTTHAYPMLLPHSITATLHMGYGRKSAADDAEEAIRSLFHKAPWNFDLEKISDRPPMEERPENTALAAALVSTASHWEIEMGLDTSTQPSVAGLIPDGTPVVAGLGPITADLCTPNEYIHRISVVQHSLVLAEYLSAQTRGDGR